MPAKKRKALTHDSLRPSRAGDQFHYIWASRRCLALLSPKSNLASISIEGSSDKETTSRPPAYRASDEVIDIAEYFGSNQIRTATKVRYLQLKHSTRRVSSPILFSELKKTFIGFYKKFHELKKVLSTTDIARVVTFEVITNRPIATSLVSGISDLSSGAKARDPNTVKKLRLLVKAKSDLTAFFSCIRTLDRVGDYQEQRKGLATEARGYLPAADREAANAIKELVTSRALPESKGRTTITREDVLQSLGTTNEDLNGAPNLIESPTNYIERAGESEIIAKVMRTSGPPIVIHADGGVGKSAISARLKEKLPTVIVYDCFGNGSYRSPSKKRHQHKIALTQIACDLAAEGLCDPIIPTPAAQPGDYLRAFLHRLGQAQATLKARTGDQKIYLIIDAADNAEIAAHDFDEGRSFVLDLLQEQLPAGIQLVVTCRTHRRNMLDLPHGVVELELDAFSPAESARHLRSHFPDARDLECQEFHRLTSRNPRVQVMAMAQKSGIGDVIKSLGESPKTVATTLGEILTASVERLKRENGKIHKHHVDKICAALAVLRPLVPLNAIALFAEIDEAAIRSFISDFGKPLRLIGNFLQFTDEPAESWFRESFTPSRDDLGRFAERLKDLASQDTYISSILPGVMLEAGMLNELIGLAIGSQALPLHAPAERREIELQRFHSAFRACLKSWRLVEAAQLAMLAGRESAGRTRQYSIIRDNVDLTAIFMGQETAEEITARRLLDSGWTGSRYIYEAALLSEFTTLHGDVPGRIRLSYAWLRSIFRRKDPDNHGPHISDTDIAHLVLAILNVAGPKSAATELSGWKPESVHYRAGTIISKRLIELGRTDQLLQIAKYSLKAPLLILSIVEQTHIAGLVVAPELCSKLITHLSNRKEKLDLRMDAYGWGHNTLQTITCLIEACAKWLSDSDRQTAIQLLESHIPKMLPSRLYSIHELNSRPALLRAYSLRSELTKTPLSSIDLESDDLKSERERTKGSMHSDEARAHALIIGTLLPCYKLFSAISCGSLPEDQISANIQQAVQSLEQALNHIYHDQTAIVSEAIRLFARIFVSREYNDTDNDGFTRLLKRKSDKISLVALMDVVRLFSGFPGYANIAVQISTECAKTIRTSREDAMQMGDLLASLSRCTFKASRLEAQSQFASALEIVSKTGEENGYRWNAILALARKAPRSTGSAETTYLFSRCAELTKHYIDREKHFPWEDTARCLCRINAPSALAILSRWRDRGFDHSYRLMTEVSIEISRHESDCAIPIATLVGIRGPWDYAEALERACAQAPTAAERVNILSTLMPYLEHSIIPVKEWSRIEKIAITNGCATDAIVTARARADVLWDEHGDEKRSSFRESHESATWSAPKESDPKDAALAKILASSDLQSAAGLSKCLQECISSQLLYSQRIFFTRAYPHIQPARCNDFLEFVFSIPDLSLWDVDGFLESFPDSWLTLSSFRERLAILLRDYVGRHAPSITVSGRNVISLRNSIDRSGVTVGELCEIVLRSHASISAPLDSEDYFALVEMIAEVLPDGLILSTLSESLKTFEPLLDANASDGPWDHSLDPQCDIHAALAGYIWSSLGSPEASTRWESAHVVRSLIALKCRREIETLLGLARSNAASAFSDKRLPIYGLHSLQWLLQALARSTLDSDCIMITEIESFAEEIEKTQVGHLMLRTLCRRIRLNCMRLSGRLAKGKSAAALIAPLKSRFKLVKKPVSHDAGEDEEALTGDDRFYFSYDFEPYWFRPISEQFGMSEKEVTRQAMVELKKLFITPATAADERRRSRIINDDRTSHSHGSYPRADDYRFYQSYHATMHLLASLLDNKPLVQSRDWSPTFSEYFRRHDITDESGYWLSDYRDPVPLPCTRLRSRVRVEDKNWRWSLRKDDFDTVLFSDDGEVVLWGSWTEEANHLEESIYVRSALVTPHASEDLLAALQTAHHHYDYNIPEAKGELEIDTPPFHFKGWVNDPDSSTTIDEMDPWSGHIAFPLPGPSPDVQQRMSLKPSSHGRKWISQHSARCAIHTDNWREFDEPYDRTAINGGQRMCASVEFIEQLIRSYKMHILIKVELKRDTCYKHSQRDYSEEPMLPSARLFLFRGNGEIVTL